ncbi:MAG: carbon-nitrogen hydrolase family protein [Candidatus Omnitrophica bacterium]|nr:carbon-nitrogen hydrolase family protein [Candidatus Omnitrophota bacterium]
MTFSETLRRSFRVSCLQVNAGSDWRKNLDRILLQAEGAFRQKADLIALPETFYWRGDKGCLPAIAREVTPLVLREFKTLASRRRIPILLGSVLECTSKPDRFANASILISDRGEIAARYRKIHLFDVALETVKVRESESMVAGTRIVATKVRGIPIGLTICYDLRFPELFRELSRRMVQIIFVPANFTYTTGRSHWEILLRARAIENQVFIVAPAQVGIHPATGIRSFGSSMVVDPWGKVLARGGRVREEIVTADLDFRELAKIRRSLPALKHRRLQ